MSGTHIYHHAKFHADQFHLAEISNPFPDKERNKKTPTNE